MLTITRSAIRTRGATSGRTMAPGRWLTRSPRPVRFAAVGGGCAVLQLLVLALLVRLGVERHGANVLAFLLSAQVNFGLSSAVTWRDRRGAAGRAAGLARRLLGFNALALGALAINQVVFALASPAAHYLIAGGLGIVTGTALTYTVSGYVIFRQRTVARPARQR